MKIRKLCSLLDWLSFCLVCCVLLGIAWRNMQTIVSADSTPREGIMLGVKDSAELSR